MESESFLNTCKNRERALKWLTWAFWAKWISTTILGFIFLFYLLPCFSNNPDSPVWSLILIQTGVTIAVFFVAYSIFSFVVKHIRKGQKWPLYLWTLYISYNLVKLSTESMGYSIQPGEAIHLTELFLTNYHCGGHESFYLFFRLAISIVVACLSLSAYACFILLRYPIESKQMNGEPPTSSNPDSQSPDDS
jgi:hypothetical protein